MIMKKNPVKLLHLVILIFSILTIISCENSDFSVKTTGNNIYIEMPSRSVGISGINKVSYGNISLNDVSEAIYDEFHGIKGLFKSGDYNVYLKTKYKNSYGEIEFSDKGKVCTLNTDEMKRYASSYYFTQDFNSKIDQMCRPTETITLPSPWN